MNEKKSHMTRVIKKRRLAVVIFVLDMILIVYMLQMKERCLEKTACVGELEWRDYKDLLVSGIEVFSSIEFLKSIETRGIIKRQDDVDENCVARILKQVMVEIRVIAYSSEIYFDNTYRNGKLVMDDGSCRRQRGYIEDLASEFMDKFNSGDVEYPTDITIAKKYVQDLKKFMAEEMPEYDCKQKVTMPSKMFPVTEISLYNYILLVLLDIRRMIVNDYKDISMWLKELELEDDVEHNLNTFRIMIMAFKWQFFIDESMYYKCQTCTDNNGSRVIDSMLNLPCGHIICRRCLKDNCVYNNKKECILCNCMISEFEYDYAFNAEDIDD
ncbi:hypothetical protein HK407_11g16250 [Ordospora pajunii]|jgi:hypothetical protein|uniref:uncharacterized protein n=1 Tax=Ordospora pajunii TaxID=3039483 RepID=UPI00295277BB|nr:uncharacterized protein HK407_11g16250 [Ordospora pajunii]KAH9410778.1 hypothetical protein HK407_11g16250 [Ordospora pajunii]